MRKSLPLSMVALLVIAFTVDAAGQTTQTWTGWISDSACGAKGANANHKDCAVRCVSGKAAAWVFVDGNSKDVLKIQNQDAVNPGTDLGQQMKLSGHLTDNGEVHVDSISPVK
jgi:hypothetical protein